MSKDEIQSRFHSYSLCWWLGFGITFVAFIIYTIANVLHLPFLPMNIGLGAHWCMLIGSILLVFFGTIFHLVILYKT